jgi:plastocyanin
MLLVRATLAVLAAALALGGCAGAGGPESPAAARDGRIAIELDDFLIRPQSLRARAGELTFAVTNDGRLGHNFRVRRRDGEPVAVKTLLPGDRATETVTLPRGDYKMLCTVANHEQLGMTGRLVVR